MPRSVASWNHGSCPPDRARSAKIVLSHRGSLQQESIDVLRQARTAVVSCWAAGVFVAGTVWSCPPALAAAPTTTQIKIKVDTEMLERALENQRGDINGAVSKIAQTIPTASIRFVPPLNADLVREWSETPEPSTEPLVDVDQMIVDTWQDITGVLSSRQPRAPNFLSQSFTVNLPVPGGTTQSVTFSIGPILLSAAFLSYPLAYAFYQFEQDQEMRAAEAKKAALKAKQATKQKTPKQRDIENTTAKEKRNESIKKGPKGSASTETASPSTVSKREEIKAEAPLVLPPIETPQPSTPQIQNVPVPVPPVPAPLLLSSPEGGMDAYEQAYAAMLSASRVSATPISSEIKKESAPAQKGNIQSMEPQTLAASPPTPPGPAKSTLTTSLAPEGGMDAYAQAYATMLSAQTGSTEIRTTAVKPETAMEPKRADPTVMAPSTTPSRDLQQRRRDDDDDDDDNSSMSAYEKAYAAMMQNSK